jgi:hypothetical protein
MQFCSQCGQGNAEDSSFCVQCGAPMPGAQQTQAGAEAPPLKNAVSNPPPPGQAQWPAAPFPASAPPGSMMPPPGYPPDGVMPAQRYVGMSIASMVLGIASIVMYPIGLILGALGIIFWKTARDELSRDRTASGAGFATAGLVCGIVGASISAVFWIVVIIAAAS